ncbi:MAG: TolC family protein [Bacteroidia bacterium]|nr:TolC family protein [Bacteroidia bacterium]
MTKKFSLAVLILCFCFVLNSQNTGTKKYSLEQCIELAVKNNESLATASLSILHEKQNKRNATEVPKTNLIYTQGQFNSIYKYDENITISQSIPFPTVFGSKYALAKAQEKSSQFQFDATKAELIYNVKICYYSLVYLKAVRKLLRHEDSIYTEFLKQVNLKFESGKATLLEKTTAETEALEIHYHLLESDEDIQNYYQELYTLIHSVGGFDISDMKLRDNYLVIQTDTSTHLKHPSLKYFEQQVDVNRKNVSLEKAKILPDFTFTYFNQTIYGPANIFGDDYFLTKSNRLQGFAIGLALPIWIFPSHSRVAAAKIYQKQAQTNFDFHATVMHGQYLQAVNQYLKYRKSLAFYKSNALINSNDIIEQASKSYDKGELSYVDYMQIVSHAITIENNYLNVIHQNNLAALKIEYLLTN